MCAKNRVDRLLRRTASHRMGELFEAAPALHHLILRVTKLREPRDAFFGPLLRTKGSDGLDKRRAPLRVRKLSV